LAVEQIIERLQEIAKQEGTEVDGAILELIARKSQGGMRDAQSMLDRLLSFSTDAPTMEQAQRIFGVIDSTFFFKLSRAVLAQDVALCFELLDEAFSFSLDIRTFCGDFLSHWRNMLLVSLLSEKARTKAAGKALRISAEDIKAFAEVCSEAESFDVQRLFDLAEASVDRALKSTFPKYVLEAGVAKMATLSSLKPLPEILQRLDQMAEQGYSAPRAPVSSARPTQKKRPLTHTEPAAASHNSTSELEEDESLETVDYDSFNPSWHDFVQHVRDRSEMVLAAFLRRVSMRKFTLGKLELEASPFDVDSLKDKHTAQSLKDCLHSYSGHRDWIIGVEELEEIPNGDSEKGNENGITESYAEGSIAAEERERNIERNKTIEKEAREHPLVKSALATFKGAKIDRIIPVKQKRG
jgi:DNA polymerase-3 subunit gamma/tau